jgi:hypothetical protein
LGLSLHVYTDFDSGAVQVPLLTVVDQHRPHYFMMGKIVGWSCEQKTHRHFKLPQIPRRIAFVFLSVCVCECVSAALAS